MTQQPMQTYSDVVHANRSLNTRLYNLRDRFKGSNCSILSTKVINYITKCFGFCVSQNVGDPESLKQGLYSNVYLIFPSARRDDCILCFFTNPH